MEEARKRKILTFGSLAAIVGSTCFSAWWVLAPPRQKPNPGNRMPAYMYPGGGKPPWYGNPESRENPAVQAAQDAKARSARNTKK